VKHNPTILVMGGGMGLGAIEKTVAKLAAVQVPATLVVVAGKNTRLKKD
jgi:processive 1,2-diacylglycerol beta-glucosyltransferase